MRRTWIWTIFLYAAFLLVIVYGSAPLFLPKSRPASVPPDQFSAERAMEHVRTLSQAPRVVGTPGIERADAYITGVLQSCGIQAEVQSNPSIYGTLHNVVARLPGSQPGQTLLIVSHFDSVSYGAGDNGSGAAVLLETACTLRASGPFTNDIILLFEDGEEKGYLGGYAFAAADPSIPAIRRVIGLDTAAWGPVVLLQTTPGNVDFIQEYGSSVKSPTAFGFFAEADWKISADTSEVQPFFERGIPGLELEDPTAFTAKHTSADTVDHVRPGSLQQMGDQMLALARSLGNADLTSASKSDLSYFTLWGLGVVRYPAGWNLVLALLACVGLVFLVGRGIRWKSASWHTYFASVGILLAMLIGSFLIGLIGSKAFEAVFPNPNPLAGSYLLSASLPAFLIISLLVGTGWAMVRRKLCERWGDVSVALAGSSLWALLALLTSVLLPVGSAIFVLPLFAAALCGFLPRRLRWMTIPPAFLAAILFTPNLVLAYLGTGLQTLPLVTVMVGLLVELWEQAYTSLSSGKEQTLETSRSGKTSGAVRSSVS